jgi:hypothetical protein
MAWRVRVTLERGEPGIARDTECAQPAGRGGPVLARPPDSMSGARWYRGDLHLHTVHSDGERHPGELVSDAQAGGLDFIVSTEHNTNAANRVWPTCRTGSLLVIPGEEVTTRHGHWLAVGLPAHGWFDWRYGPRGAGGGHIGAEAARRRFLLQGALCATRGARGAAGPARCDGRVDESRLVNLTTWKPGTRSVPDAMCGNTGQSRSQTMTSTVSPRPAGGRPRPKTGNRGTL